MMTTLPSITPAMVMKRTSWFLTCPISWAITPCSSSRLRRFNNPEVTATQELSGLRPAANAFGTSSSIT